MGDASILHMPTALIFGGNGKTGRALTKLLLGVETPHTVFGVIRNPDQAEGLRAIGAKPIVQDIAAASEADFIRIFEGTRPDLIVWAAGGKDQASAEAVDRDGAIRAMNALAKARVHARRYVVVSALDTRDHERKPVPDWYSEEDRKLTDRMYAIIGPICRAKLAADKELRVGNDVRKLDYTIVRPGGLGEGPANGLVRAGKVGAVGIIPREDLARVIYAVYRNDQTLGFAFDVLGPGDGDAPVEAAVARAAKHGEDTFEGYY